VTLPVPWGRRQVQRRKPSPQIRLTGPPVLGLEHRGVALLLHHTFVWMRAVVVLMGSGTAFFTNVMYF
jgi:hypothetical protein